MYTGGKAPYMNAWGSVHWEGMYRVVEHTLGVQIFLLVY